MLHNNLHLVPHCPVYYGKPKMPGNNVTVIIFRSGYTLMINGPGVSIL